MDGLTQESVLDYLSPDVKFRKQKIFNQFNFTFIANSHVAVIFNLIFSNLPRETQDPIAAKSF